MKVYVQCGVAAFILLLHVAASSISIENIAAFVTVDYLWTTNYSRALYEENGLFVVANNAITGIKVSRQGDIFVSVPRWMSGVPSSLNVLVANPNGPGYVLNPWPSWEFNAVNVSGSLQYAQSFLIDSQNRMWIPEVGRTNFYDANPELETSGPAGVFIVDVGTGALLSRYYFPEDVVSYNNSFVNDIVLDEATGFAYFTNTWADGGIIVYDSLRNESKMFSGPCTQRNASYDFCVNGICYGTDGVGASPSDGIALSSDGATLYFSAVQGVGLYAINTSYLQNFSMTNAEFQQHAVFLGDKTGCSDGLLWLNDNLYYGNIQTSALGSLADLSDFTATGSLTSSASVDTASSPSTLNWIDTFSVDFNDSTAFYFTSNKLNLFFTASMDFTGQSGPNFQIFHATVDDSSSSSSNNSVSNEAKRDIVVTFAVVFLAAMVSCCAYKFFKDRRKTEGASGEAQEGEESYDMDEDRGKAFNVL